MITFEFILHYWPSHSTLFLSHFTAIALSVTVCVYVLQKPQGLLCIIDEESQSLRPCEVSLYKRVQIQLDSSCTDAVSLTTKDGNGNPPPKDQGPSFTVNHYAGKVGYGKLRAHTCSCWAHGHVLSRGLAHKHNPSHTLLRSPPESQHSMSCWEWGLLLGVNSCVFVCPILQMTYDLTGSLDKNKDVLPQNIMFVMKSKEWEFCAIFNLSMFNKLDHGNRSSYQKLYR